jgi:nitrate/TMAO reductase-like tetraheme cytochrome c subunit
MSLGDRIRFWLRPAAYLAGNPITLAGAVITTSSAITLIGFWFFEVVLGASVHPYLGVLLFLILPGVFVIGLVLIPVGALLRRHQLRKSGEIPNIYPPVSLHSGMARHAIGWIAGLTIVNVVIFAAASYQGVNYMDSAKFCGQTCHVVMQPEFTAYQSSPHQRVACVQCHIGPGAGWFVRSKISGARQVLAVTFRTYDRPIPSPVEQLRPARETCEQCHWPQMFTSDKLIVRKKYSDDEKNTPLTTILLLKIGGNAGHGGVGIHGRHLNAGSRIQYVATDRQRQNIAEVFYTDDAGKQVDFRAPAADPKTTSRTAGPSRAETRAMDCVDCHNRPTHTFQMPETAVDQALSDGRISPDLPFVKRVAVKTLKETYPDRDTAVQRIASAFREFYKSSYPALYRDKRPIIEVSAAAVQNIYLRNIFPAMNVGWGTYANNLGHMDFPGCFRCHDGSHSSADGRMISNDCDACHHLLAVDDADPKILTDLGLK